MKITKIVVLASLIFSLLGCAPSAPTIFTLVRSDGSTSTYTPAYPEYCWCDSGEFVCRSGGQISRVEPVTSCSFRFIGEE